MRSQNLFRWPIETWEPVWNRPNLFLPEKKTRAKMQQADAVEQLILAGA
jgi:hypothetical protein